MKREKIEKLIDYAIRGKCTVNCVTEYDDEYFNIIPLARSKDFVLAARDVDFLIDGYLIVPIDNIRKIREKAYKYNEILRAENVLEQIDCKLSDARTYREIFGTLLEKNIPFALDTKRGYFLGNVLKAGKNGIKMSQIAPSGYRPEPNKIGYDEILTIYFGNRHTDFYVKYADSLRM